MSQVQDEETVASVPTPTVRLLVVDDEPDVETLFRLRFRNEIRSGRLDVQFLTDPLQAIGTLEDNPDIEVLITDLNMPKMHGLELLERVEDLHRPLKVIVVTAYGDLTNIRAAMMRGAFDFQVKPFDAQDLRATIAKAVDLVRELRAGSEAAKRASALAERNRFVEDVFGRYVSEEVKGLLLASPEGHWHSERRVVTTLMADIRGFSRLVERSVPEVSVEVLNQYFEMASSIILARNGTINEIMGDGLLVLFGAPLPDPLAAEHAARAALELQMAMTELNERSRRQGLPALNIGIGINTGEAVLGTIGSSTRQKYAAVGSHVNLAARMEGQTVGGQILISAATAAAIGADAVLSPGRQVQFKGLDAPTTVHELYGMQGEDPVRLTSRVHELRPVVPPAPAVVSLVVNARVAAPHSAEVVAFSPLAARIHTDLRLAPFDDVAIELWGHDYLAKIQPDAENAEDHLAVFTSVPESAGTEVPPGREGSP